MMLEQQATSQATVAGDRRQASAAAAAAGWRPLPAELAWRRETSNSQRSPVIASVANRKG